MEYFISSFGARKTMADKKLVTASAGHLTRMLVEAAYPLVITASDCGATQGIPLRRFVPLMGEQLPLLETRLTGRVPLKDVRNGRKKLARAGEPITPEQAQAIGDAGLAQVVVRSPVTCQNASGLCRKCYGWDLSTRAYPDLWMPVGIIAGQSIGERGTQLTMRTFHTGGVKGEAITSGLPRIKRLMEGWVDMRRLQEMDAGNQPIPGTERAEWDALMAVEATAGKDQPLRFGFYLDSRKRAVAQAHRLQTKREELGEETFCHCFLWEMHRVYKGEVDDRHFEVILRAMRSPANSKLVGVSQAVLGRPGFLAKAAFQRAVDVLATAAVGQVEDPLEGFKERLMVGRLVHRVEESKDGSPTEGQQEGESRATG
jgi:DNA-directed RNA polymerase subunit beta'